MHADPGLRGLPRPTAVSGQVYIVAANMVLAIAVLSDGGTVPITIGIDSEGDECRLDDSDLVGFVAGSDWTGWWYEPIINYNFSSNH